MGKEKNVGLLRRWFAVTNSPRNGRNGFAFSMYGTNRRSADCRWIRKFQTVPAARGPAHTISYVKLPVYYGFYERARGDGGGRGGGGGGEWIKARHISIVDLGSGYMEEKLDKSVGAKDWDPIRGLHV